MKLKHINKREQCPECKNYSLFTWGEVFNEIALMGSIAATNGDLEKLAKNPFHYKCNNCGAKFLKVKK